jgi:hypothetical protein
LINRETNTMEKAFMPMEGLIKKPKRARVTAPVKNK